MTVEQNYSLLLSVQKPTQHLMQWWNQFPPGLHLITKVRLIASIGAGGVIYLTPLVFNQLELSATEIGTGLAIAALIGAIARLCCGKLLDNGLRCSWAVRSAALLTATADITLLNAQTYEIFLIGQLILGTSAGIYWPAVELAVPNSCNSYQSSKGFALVRSADALGISIGAFTGVIWAYLNSIQLIYILDILCMIILISLLWGRPLTDANISKLQNSNLKNSKRNNKETPKGKYTWLISLIPIFALSLLSTGVFALIQSALPLDLVKGSLIRAPLDNVWSSCLIAIQLMLLVILQWPVGSWLSNKSIKFGMSISLISFFIGCLLLGISGLSQKGLFIIFVAQVPMAIGLAAFLPTATEGVIRQTPINKRGFALALYSQCFALSAFFAPLIAGHIIDRDGHSLILWIGAGLLCLISLPLTIRIKKT